MTVASEFKEKLHSFPLTIMYVESLESLGYFYQVLTYELKEKAYHGNRYLRSITKTIQMT